MSADQQEKELREAMAASRAEYASLSQEYDRLLDQAHAFEHGSPEVVKILIAANALGRQMADALRHHHNSVEQLTAFYLSRQTTGHK